MNPFSKETIMGQDDLWEGRGKEFDFDKALDLEHVPEPKVLEPLEFIPDENICPDCKDEIIEGVCSCTVASIDADVLDFDPDENDGEETADFPIGVN
jgi:hypothetical protein